MLPSVPLRTLLSVVFVQCSRPATWCPSAHRYPLYSCSAHARPHGAPPHTVIRCIFAVLMPGHMVPLRTPLSVVFLQCSCPATWCPSAHRYPLYSCSDHAPPHGAPPHTVIRCIRAVLTPGHMVPLRTPLSVVFLQCSCPATWCPSAHRYPLYSCSAHARPHGAPPHTVIRCICAVIMPGHMVPLHTPLSVVFVQCSCPATWCPSAHRYPLYSCSDHARPHGAPPHTVIRCIRAVLMPGHMVPLHTPLSVVFVQCLCPATWCPSTHRYPLYSCSDHARPHGAPPHTVIRCIRAVIMPRHMVAVTHCFRLSAID
ncbi:uncharacterized protein LOC125718881 isoform X2 [Brienomyrus brachyistius]|uniref:uncharacterized protein LOC125718881 isoform X2 n=1 Tax=Brienomyrus brachyistius TaxID=42636 RepID=UPI0020B39368|nr:uncharacterized protein LOC125718881 isoform X2 [Brienomyrus brachyistius]